LMVQRSLNIIRQEIYLIFMNIAKEMWKRSKGFIAA